MIRNYFKTALRNLIRNLNFSLINVIGLAAGISICLIIFLIIQFELSFDNFHSRKDRIYRVLTEYHHADAANVFYGRGVPEPLPSALKKNFPQVEKVAAIQASNYDQILVLNENGETIRKFKEEKGVFFSEPSFFDIFNFPFIAGNASTALQNPNAAVLSREIAEKYFGDWKTALGKTIRWNNAETLKITGILETVPANTDLPLKVIISMGTGSTAGYANSTNWDGTGSSYGCYILVKPQTSESSMNAQLFSLSRKMKSADNKDSHIIQSLSKEHFDTEAGTFGGKTISLKVIRALWMIAAFILLIACVNFINLSTAQAVHRAKEVGVRKVLGSNSWQLKGQFLAETFIVVLVSLLLSIGIAFLLLPTASKIMDIPLSINLIRNTSILLFLLLIAITVTFLAGFYPSIVISRFNPIQALRSKLAAGSTKGISLRRGLVAFQFIIAQALIIATLIMVRQINFFTSQPLGFDKDAIVNIPFPADSTGISKLPYLRKRLSEIGGIQQVSFSSNTPVEDNNDSWSTFKYNHAPKETEFYAIIKMADHKYVPTYSLPLVAGRNLEPSDSVREFLVNESLIKNLGIKNPQDAINKQIDLWGQFHGPIVGVLKDFHDRSFRAPVAPLMMLSLKAGYGAADIKLSMKDPRPVLRSIERIWGEAYPEFVFDYQFLDSKIESFYKQENKLSDIFRIFAIVAIFLSCLGLYGLASFMAIQRIKEVGIRKVLGASAQQIVYLFSREFMILIGIAFLVASPIAWFFMNKWLQDYVYRIDISWWIFLLGGLASILIALGTVSFQAIKAAVANPVNSLRSE